MYTLLKCICICMFLMLCISTVRMKEFISLKWFMWWVLIWFQNGPVSAVTKRTRSLSRKSSSDHEKSDIGQMDKFCAFWCKNRSKQSCEGESTSNEKDVDDESQVNVSVKTENVRRSSRLSAQAAATAIARALQVFSVCWSFWTLLVCKLHILTF